MNKLLITVFLIFTGCGFATIPDVIVKTDSMIKEFGLYDYTSKETKECKITNNLIQCNVPNEWNKSMLSAVFKVDNLTQVHYQDNAQNSGVSYQDYTDEVVLKAVNMLGSSLKYVVRVSSESEILIESYSPTIKITSIEDNIHFDIERSPVQELVGVPQEDILYCFNTSIEDSLMIGMNNDLTKTTDFVCENYYSYEELLKKIEITEDPFFYNIIAVYDYHYYIYQRIYVSENIELYTGDCSTFVNNIEDFDNVVLSNTLSCESVSCGINKASIVVNGNGYSFNNLIGTFGMIQNSLLLNIKLIDSKNIANELVFVRIEKLNIQNGYNSELESAGLVCNRAYDLTIHGANISGIVISDLGEAGLITGVYISNFPMFPFIFNDIKINGISSSNFIAGGMFGFLISYAEIFNTNIEVEVTASVYQGCLAGGIIDQPYKENVIEECTY